MLPAEVIAICILLLASLSGVDAQAKFEWGFTESVSTSLQSCKSLLLEADALPGGNNGVPPYYMMAFPVNGTPITTFIGTNESNLSWQPQFPAGTQLLLGVVDSQRNTGGIDIPLYTVIAGDTQCIPPTPQSDFVVTANVTDELTTCQPWGLKIQGGLQPYNVTIAALNSTTVTNVTLGPTDSVFTYINRADPGSQMIASVSDATGRWATGSPFVHTTGSSNVDCQGSGSFSGNSSGDNDSTPAHPAKLGAIIGGAGAALLLLCALGFAAIWWRRRRAARSPDMRLTIAPFETSALDHSWQMSAVHTPTPFPAPRGDHKHSGSASFLLPGSSSSSDPRGSSPSHSHNNSTGASTPTSASPLVFTRDLPPPPPYALPEFDPYQLKP
ncbi:hypothetical protein DFH06DRAFT_1034040 [Mycena polygramma]|nr:hypothetical protein DFH06DRAFT_1034040 [Mycena polygramma]